MLIIRLAGMGDVLLATPVVRALRRARPEAHLAFMVEKRFREVVCENPDLDEIIPLWVPNWFPQRRSLGLRVLRKLSCLPASIMRTAGRQFDVVIDLDSTILGWLCSMTARAPERVITWYQKVPPILARRYSGIVTPRPAEHAIDYQMRTLDLLGLPWSRPELVLMPTAEDRRRVEALVPWSDLPATLIGVHPGASLSFKCWAFDRYLQLCQRLSTRRDIGVVVVGGKEEREQARRIVEMFPNRVALLAGRTSVGETAAALARCSLFVGNDSGPMHIAESQGVSVLCLMGPTPPFWKGPYGRSHQIIDASLACPNGRAARPGPLRRCQCGHCLEQLPVDIVLERVLFMLDVVDDELRRSRT